LLTGIAASSVFAMMPEALAQGIEPAANDRVFICNEDSNTLSVIDPKSDSIIGTVNLTSFDEDPRPPFRLVRVA
jgi:YVTN family beta-propeller protein